MYTELQNIVKEIKGDLNKWKGPALMDWKT